MEVISYSHLKQIKLNYFHFVHSREELFQKARTAWIFIGGINKTAVFVPKEVNFFWRSQYTSLVKSYFTTNLFDFKGVCINAVALPQVTMSPRCPSSQFPVFTPHITYLHCRMSIGYVHVYRVTKGTQHYTLPFSMNHRKSPHYLYRRTKLIWTSATKKVWMHYTWPSSLTNLG